MDVASLTALANSKLEGVKAVYEAYEERIEDDEVALRQWRDSMAVALDQYYALQPSVVGKKAGVKRVLFEMAKNAKDLFNDVDASLGRKKQERERLAEGRMYDEARRTEDRRNEDGLRRSYDMDEGAQRLVDGMMAVTAERDRNNFNKMSDADDPPSAMAHLLNPATTSHSYAIPTGSSSSYDSEVLALLPEDHRILVVTDNEKNGRWAIPNYVPEGEELTNPNSPLYRCEHKGKTHDGAKGKKEKWKGDQRCTQCRVHNVSPCLSTGCHACASCTQKKQGPCSHTYGGRKSLETQLADRRAKQEKERAKADVMKLGTEPPAEPPKQNDPRPSTVLTPVLSLNGNRHPMTSATNGTRDSDDDDTRSVVELDADTLKLAGPSRSLKKRPRPTGRIERLEDELDDINRRISQAEDLQQQAFDRIHSATLDAQRAATAMQLGYRDKQRIEHDLERERERSV
ncbi:hypothetical protein ONZ45_g13885 [Pleurotus djamor]|nr:hypothetical protein ONZ45_g13885 [Pleurotus djamor]